MLLFQKVFGMRRSKKPNPELSISGPFGKRSRALKIVHAGGCTERYYMAIPAIAITEKNPSSYLTRPDIFKRPWDSVVRPSEMLLPGQKYYVVPVKKLRHRTTGSGSSSVRSIGLSRFGILVKPGSRMKVSSKKVRFFGDEMNNEKSNNVTIDTKKILRSVCILE